MKNKRKKDLPTIITKAVDITSENIFYILDEDPVQASRFLTASHIPEQATKILESLTYRYLTMNDLMAELTLRNYHFKPLSFIYQTPYNIIYFSRMYEELAKIYKLYSGHEPAEPIKCEKDKILFNTDLALVNSKDYKLIIPNYLPLIKKRKNLNKYNILGIDNPSNTFIDIYRLMYIIDGYSLDQFPCGAPSWYSPMRREIYRKYDRVSKKTFVIMMDEQGNYRYYYQHISNKLREITDIKNIRPLIDSFLFKV